MSDTGHDLRDSLAGPSASWSQLRSKVDHADKAYEFLNSGAFKGDPEVTKGMITAADVHAKLALSDKLEELTQTLRLGVGQVLDAVSKLDSDIQTAAQHLHKDAHELKAHLRVIEGQRDAA